MEISLKKRYHKLMNPGEFGYETKALMFYGQDEIVDRVKIYINTGINKDLEIEIVDYKNDQNVVLRVGDYV